MDTAKNLINTLLQYPFLTHWLYIPHFLGLNMIEPLKPLIDSGLAVFLLSVSNKTAPKGRKNAPIFGRGRVKINLPLIPSSRRWRKGKHIFLKQQKPPRSSLTVAGHLINL